jgi:hypothetical protein
MKQMMKWLLPLCMLAPLPISAQDTTETETEARTLKLYDNFVFFDGYQLAHFENVELPEDDDPDVLRHMTYLCAKRLTDEDLAWFGSDVTLNVVIGALCDNYDRIGNVNIALVPKGSETYNTDDVQRFEIARFITPFMNKNKTPDEVPYTYRLDALSYIMHDSRLREEYDLWLEFEVFGVPYAANSQIDGCSGRNDVFRGTLYFESNSEPMEDISTNVLVPINMKNPVWKERNLNNYNATDETGVCVRTWNFTVPEELSDARITVIISNHGANTNGEEYNRREHFVYVDDDLKLDFIPGGKSCEPYRQYNTQTNGIYGYWAKTDAYWASFSNWCPGDAIPIREIDLGAFSAGEHSVKIHVPDAVFNGTQGDFPVSIYLQGVTQGELPSGIFTAKALDPELNVVVDGEKVSWSSSREVVRVSLYDLDGGMIHAGANRGDSLSLAGIDSGVYLLTLTDITGYTTVRKILRQ